jgi:hypothetical protein
VPRSLVEVHTLTVFVTALMMEGAVTSKTSVEFYKIVRRYKPQGSHLQMFTFMDSLKD